MNRPTEYQALKRLLFARKELDPNLSGHDVNQLIQDSSVDVYENQLDAIERQYVMNAKNRLINRVPDLGIKGALEVLAVVGDWMNEMEKKCS